jgi:SAM-dependent methyltransferase
MKIYTPSDMSPTVAYYNINAYEYFYMSVKADMSELYQQFLKFVPHGGVILDAGCGSGRDTKYFLSLGYQVIAIDASKKMVKLSTEYTKHQTSLMNFYDLNFQNDFDGIWAISSLVHIPKQDIDYIIKSLTNALKIGGIWCISFKEGLGEKIEDGRFFNDYTQETFSSLINNHPRLEIERLWDNKDAMGRDQNWMTAIVRKIKS